MATQITASIPRTRTAPRLSVLAVAILAATVAAAIAIGAWSQAGSTRDVPIDSLAYGVGYPLHGGLAGPSRVGDVSSVGGPSGPVAAVGLPAHYGAGYPLHGGLAGPGRPASTHDLAAHYGAGYPLHGGLAGPGLVEDGN